VAAADAMAELQVLHTGDELDQEEDADWLAPDVQPETLQDVLAVIRQVRPASHLMCHQAACLSAGTQAACLQDTGGPGLPCTVGSAWLREAWPCDLTSHDCATHAPQGGAHARGGRLT